MMSMIYQSFEISFRSSEFIELSDILHIHELIFIIILFEHI